MPVFGRAWLGVLLMACLMSLATADEPRTWTNREGKQIKATFKELDGTTVKMVLPNGKSAAVPLANLSDADQEWVKSQAEPPPPPVKPPPEPVPPTNPSPKEKVVNWAPFKDAGDRIPELPPIPEPDPNALIPVLDSFGSRNYFYLRPDGTDAFPHLNFKSRVLPFSDGLALVQTDKHLGYINREGKWVLGGDGGVPLPEGADSFESFSEGRAKFRLNGRIGFIDTSGKVVIPADRYYGALPFSDGLAAVNDNRDIREENWCYIDRDGKVAIPGPWPAVGVFAEGVAWVCMDRGVGVQRFEGRKRLINTKGQPVFGDAVFLETVQHLAQGGFLGMGERIYRTDGSAFLEPAQDYRLTGFSKDGTLAFANIKGEAMGRLVHLPSMTVYGPMIRAKYLKGFEEGLTTIWLGNDIQNPYTCIDRTGKRAFADSFASEPEFKDGYAVVNKWFGEKEQRSIVINRKGETIWKGEASR